MHPHEPLRICTKCRIPHYENCPDCLGFGQYRKAVDGATRVAIFATHPVSAAQAHGDRPAPPNLEPCPTCGSTINGAFHRHVIKLVQP